jgi:hypothetical protein
MCTKSVIAVLTYKINIILNRELSKRDIKYIREGRKLQKDLAIELWNKIFHDIDEPFGLPDFIKVGKYLKNFCIKIVCAENFNTCMYKGIGKRDVTIFLYENKNHFDVITKIGTFLGMPSYCSRSDTPCSCW